MRETLPHRNSSSIRSPMTNRRWPAKRAIVSVGIASGLGPPQRFRRWHGGGLARHRHQREPRPGKDSIHPAQQPYGFVENLQHQLADTARPEHLAVGPPGHQSSFVEALDSLYREAVGVE